MATKLIEVERFCEVLDTNHKQQHLIILFHVSVRKYIVEIMLTYHICWGLVIRYAICNLNEL